jgi:hypothetical protein
MRERFLAWIQPHTPTFKVRGAGNGVWQASAASTVQFGENFITQKLWGAPVLVGADHIFGSLIWIWKDLGPMYFWSHGQSFSGRVYKTKFVVYLPNSQFGQFLTSKL